MYLPVFVDLARWDDVDPRCHPFDASEVEGVVLRPLRAGSHGKLERLHRRAGESPSHALVEAREAVEREVDRALRERWGLWIGGWRWAASEPGGGGPVRAWCCAGDSLDLRDHEAIHASALRVRDAVVDWRLFLEDLADRFDALDARTSGHDLASAAERAGAELVALVVERTDATDAWYHTFAVVLRWYLERRGDPSVAIRRVVHRLASGVFASWTAPSDSDVDDVCRSLGRELRDTRALDATAAWQVARDMAFRHVHPLRRVGPTAHDGHLAYVTSRDRARSRVRATRIRAALDAVRLSAVAGESLTLERLSTWLSIALGRSAALRRGDAFAKDGREWYGLPQDLPALTDRYLREASRRRRGVLVRAARVYLDLCFIHPFDDGNARAARLALDHVLTSESLALRAAEPLFDLARGADDERGAWHFAALLGLLVGETPVRAVEPQGATRRSGPSRARGEPPPT